MAYKSSPRPNFDRPTHIPYAGVTRHLWGDDISGKVDDWIYVSSNRIHELVFGLPPRGAFRHSPEYRTVFGADEVLHVLEGTYVSANPETGEVHVAEAGDAIFFRKDTWHHGFNGGTGPVRVLEFFAPPPSTGASGAYARSRPYLDSSRYTRDDWLGRLPMEASALKAANTMLLQRKGDVVWRLEGARQQMLVGLHCATEHLTAGRIRLMPGEVSDIERHGGDEALYLLAGSLNILAPEADGQVWFELHPKDGFYVPAGAPHQYHNVGSEPLEILFGVAPRYLP